jgi:hypothetical protein
VVIVDNFLPKDLLHYVQWVLPKMNYELHYSQVESNGTADNFLKSVGEFPEDKIFEYIAYELNNFNFINITNILRCYSNLNPQGSFHSGDWHIDDGMITALFYPMPWNPEFGGGTEFKDGNLVEYKENRIVFFDAKREHRAIAHTNDSFRYSVAYKLEAFWNEDCINN